MLSLHIPPFLQVPASLRFVLEGEMPPYLLAKDLILQIIGEVCGGLRVHHCAEGKLSL